MWWEPKQAHPATSRQTSETADYNPVAPSTGVPTAGRKTPGAVRRSAAVLVESKGGPHPNTAPRSPWSYQQGQRAPVPGCCAEDAFPAPAPQARGRKTIQPDSEKSRASPNCPRCLTAKRIIQNDSRRPVFQQTARLAINGFEVHVLADEDGILAQIAKGNILQTETCFGWNDKLDNDGSGRRSLIGSSARRWHYRLGLDSAGIVTKLSVSVCRNVTMSLSSWLVSPRLPIKWDTLVGVSGGGQQLTFSPGEN